MYSGNDNNMEVAQLKESLELLKKKLDRQDIVNQKLIRRAMKHNISQINRNGIFTIVLGCIAVPFCTLIFRYSTGLSWTFCIITGVFLLICVIATWLIHKDIMRRDFMEQDLVSVSLAMAKLKRQYVNWLKFAIPCLILWLMWLGWEFVRVYDIKLEIGFIISALIGGAIGGAIGYTKDRQTVKLAEKTIEQIEELKNED